MQASLLGCALESYVVDNDMLGGILSSLRPLEMDVDSLSAEAIDREVRSVGHFLEERETPARMKCDFLCPDIAGPANARRVGRGGWKGDAGDGQTTGPGNTCPATTRTIWVQTWMIVCVATLLSGFPSLAGTAGNFSIQQVAAHYFCL